MGKIHIFDSIVEENIKKEMKDAEWCFDLVQYATCKCKIDGLIAAAYLFCPQIIKVKDYIFVKQFWNYGVETSIEHISHLEEQFGKNKKMIEMSVNTCSIGDFFVGDCDELMDNEKVLQQFGDVIVYFWKQRVKELFPEKEMVVELGTDLMGEYGLCITMYELD